MRPTRILFVRQPMPGLNEIIAECERSPFHYNRMKKKWMETVLLYAREQGFAALTGPAHFEIECVEPSRRRDPDNVVGGALKIVFDALKQAKLLPNDGWKHVLSIKPSWSVDKMRPGVRLTATMEDP